MSVRTLVVVILALVVTFAVAWMLVGFLNNRVEVGLPDAQIRETAGSPGAG